MWIAEAGVHASLPPNWKVQSTEDEVPYFWNQASGESSWEHPLDQGFRDLIRTERHRKTAQKQLRLHFPEKRIQRSESAANIPLPATSAASSVPSSPRKHQPVFKPDDPHPLVHSVTEISGSSQARRKNRRGVNSPLVLISSALAFGVVVGGLAVAIGLRRGTK
mmetsp:Transcript_30063/g.70740  ORF Transcript_30063/g.70740 Transcript_30063/m.70740 type:complete len:164 (-) Transcript_30063:1102-1593(-)